MRSRLVAALLLLAGIVFIPAARATANYQYKPNEYVQINGGLSPDGQYSLRAHGDGELGDENFHVYLFEAKTGRKIGPLEEVKDALDTAADAIDARWSADSRTVTISYRVDRREKVSLTFRIANGRAALLSGGSKR